MTYLYSNNFNFSAKMDDIISPKFSKVGVRYIH